MFYNVLLERIILPIGDFLTGSDVMKRLKEFKRVVSLPEKDIDEYSKNKLIKILNFATQEIPYYKRQNIEKCDNPYDWIKSFPIMRKPEIRKNIDDLISKPKNMMLFSSTSGSSGEHGILYKDKEVISTGRALTLLIWEWGGFKLGMPVLQTGMSIKRGLVKSIKDFLFRTEYYNAFGLSESEAENLLIKRKKLKNQILIGYASSLYVLADVCVNKDIKNVSFVKAISLGDKMFPHYRSKIKEAFGCDVSDTYGLSEELTIAAQKDNEFYYILTPHVYIEILDDFGNEVNDGSIGHVIATSLDAYGMPLIRYDTGDLAIKLPSDRYPEKRDLMLPLLEKIIGRDTDIVKTRSGKFMIVHFFTGIFEYIPEIKQFKVVQKELDCMEIEYIPGDNFNFSICESIEKKIHDYLQEPFPIFWKEVKEIQPTLSGKPQIIQSLLVK